MNSKELYRIQLVVEGAEEKYFFTIVKQKGLDSGICLNIRNAVGFGKIGPIYQDYINNEELDAVFAVYDVDGRSEDGDSPYNMVKKQLLRILGSNSAVKAASLCTNPNILQLYLLGCDCCIDNVSLKSSSKDKNTDIINKYWPDIGKRKKNDRDQFISNNYDAEDWQLTIMANSYIYDIYDYNNLLNNCDKLPVDYEKNIPSSNLYEFLEALKEGNIDFFISLTKAIEDLDK